MMPIKPIANNYEVVSVLIMQSRNRSIGGITQPVSPFRPEAFRSPEAP